MLGFGTPQAIYKWQRGDTLPTIDNFVVLSSVFGVKIDDILAVGYLGGLYMALSQVSLRRRPLKRNRWVQVPQGSPILRLMQNRTPKFAFLIANIKSIL